MDFISTYSIPIWKSTFPTFKIQKNDFLDIIYKQKELNDSTYKHNIFGYRSFEYLHTIKELDTLFSYIFKMAVQACRDINLVECDLMFTTSWFVINYSKKCMVTEHVHGDLFSGVFYLKTPKDSGRLVIQNPGINRSWKGCSLTSEKNQFTAENIHIKPMEGDIIMFPSYIPHSVETNNHDEERISISFNLGGIPKEVKIFKSQKESDIKKNLIKF